PSPEASPPSSPPASGVVRLRVAPHVAQAVPAPAHDDRGRLIAPTRIVGRVRHHIVHREHGADWLARAIAPTAIPLPRRGTPRHPGTQRGSRVCRPRLPRSFAPPRVSVSQERSQIEPPVRDGHTVLGPAPIFKTLLLRWPQSCRGVSSSTPERPPP